MDKIREKLFEKQDLKYKEFHSSLCPNVDKIIGVRVPELRKMAIAWLISFSYIKQKEKTKKYLLKNNLDKFTHNKSIQKICESYRVLPEEKEELKRIKK